MATSTRDLFRLKLNAAMAAVPVRLVGDRRFRHDSVPTTVGCRRHRPRSQRQGHGHARMGPRRPGRGAASDRRRRQLYPGWPDRGLWHCGARRCRRYVVRARWRPDHFCLCRSHGAHCATQRRPDRRRQLHCGWRRRGQQHCTLERQFMVAARRWHKLPRAGPRHPDQR